MYTVYSIQECGHILSSLLHTQLLSPPVCQLWSSKIHPPSEHRKLQSNIEKDIATLDANWQHYRTNVNFCEFPVLIKVQHKRHIWVEWLVEFSFLHGAKGRPGTLLSCFPQSLEHVLHIPYSHEKSSDWHEALAKYKKTTRINLIRRLKIWVQKGSYLQILSIHFEGRIWSNHFERQVRRIWRAFSSHLLSIYTLYVVTQRSPTSSWHTASVTSIVTGIWKEFWQRKELWAIALSASILIVFDTTRRVHCVL